MVSADAEEKKLEDVGMDAGGGETGTDADQDDVKEGEADKNSDKEQEFEKSSQENSDEEKLSQKSDEEEKKDEEKLGKKWKSSNTEDLDEKEPVTPSQRPTRERKNVERYSAPYVVRSTTPKNVTIEKGSRIKLSEIPNVAYKLSKKKPDDNLQLLHTILFGKKAKVHMLKRNLGQFSGFVWSDNVEKQKAKIKGKIDKCVKDKLVEYCHLFDIQINKATAKKEELSVKLMEFLQSPHATTDGLLAGAEQKNKSKRKATPAKADRSSERPAKKRKTSSEASQKKAKASKVEEEKEQESEEEGEPSDEDELHIEKSEEKTESDNSEEDEPTPDRKDTSKKKASKESASKEKSKDPKEAPPAKSNKKIFGSARKGTMEASAASGSQSKVKGSSSKKQIVEKERETNIKDKGKTKSKKETNTPPTKVPAKSQGNGKSNKSKEPTREEMHAVVVNILKEVNFDTTTINDVLRQLGIHFAVNLQHREAEVREIVTEVISNMTDDEEDEDEEKGDKEAEKVKSDDEEEQEENKKNKTPDEEEEKLSDQEDQKDNKDQEDDDVGYNPEKLSDQEDQKDNKDQEDDDIGKKD